MKNFWYLVTALLLSIAFAPGTGQAQPAGPIPAPESLLAPVEADTLFELDLGIFPPEGIQIPYSYQIDWGDGDTLDWSQPLRITYDALFSHRYTRLGEFDIRARVRDSLQRVSDWSRPVAVQVAESRLKWKFDTFDPVIAAPALDENGNTYISDDDGWTYSIDPTGILRWGFETEDAIFAAAMLHGDRVYVVSLDSVLYCLDRNKGTQVWKRALGDEAYGPPAIDAQGNIIVATEGGKVIAVSSRGRVVWEFDTGEEIYGSPSIGPDGSIVVASDSLYCLDSKGRRRWAWGAQPQDGDYIPDEYFIASPVLDPAGNVYIGSSEGNIYAVGPGGSLLWSLTLPNIDEVCAELAVGPDGAFWLGTDAGYFYRIDPQTREVETRFETLDIITNTAAVSDKGTAYFASDDGYFYALRSDGRLAWRHQLAQIEKETFYTSSPLIGPDGTVYIGSWEGGLYAFRGDGPPAPSFWPQYRRDARNTGRVGAR